MSSVEAVAKSVAGVTDEQAREFAKYMATEKPQGVWTTTTATIVTHTDGSRHWSTADCEQCAA